MLNIFGDIIEQVRSVVTKVMLNINEKTLLCQKQEVYNTLDIDTEWDMLTELIFIYLWGKKSA